MAACIGKLINVYGLPDFRLLSVEKVLRCVGNGIQVIVPIHIGLLCRYRGSSCLRLCNFNYVIWNPDRPSVLLVSSVADIYSFKGGWKQYLRRREYCYFSWSDYCWKNRMFWSFGRYWEWGWIRLSMLFLLFPFFCTISGLNGRQRKPIIFK